MEKRDFQLVARILHETGRTAETYRARLHHNQVIEEMTRAFEMEYPNFDPGRFLSIARKEV